MTAIRFLESANLADMALNRLHLAVVESYEASPNTLGPRGDEIIAELAQWANELRAEAQRAHYREQTAAIKAKYKDKKGGAS